MSSTVAAGLFPVRAVLDNGAVVIVHEAAATPAVAINATFWAGSQYNPIRWWAWRISPGG